MTQPIHPTAPPLTPEVEGVLAGLGRRIRLYVVVQGLAAVAAVLGLAFWVSLLIDQPWLWEPSRAARAAILAGVGVLVLVVLFRWVILRGLARLSRGSMALLLERRFRQFDDGLMTTVELAGRPASELGYSPEMLLHTADQARRRAADVDLGQVFNLGPLARSMAAALVLAASVAAFAVAAPQHFGIWARRCLLLSAESWPRYTELTVVGFENGLKKVARGSDLDVLVRANAAKTLPRAVQIRYRTDEGFRERVHMEQDGVARPGVDPYQQFSHRFQGLLTSVSFDVVGGDDRRRDLRVQVVDGPTIEEMTLFCEYPAYIGRSPRELPVSGAMQLPEGTRITVRAKANKPLVSVTVDSPPAESSATATGPLAIDMSAGGRPHHTFHVRLQPLSADRVLLFSLADTDGIASREPVRLALAMISDASPEAKVQLRGIGSAVTPQARIPVAGELVDDYGLAAAWFEYQVDEEPEAGRRPLASAPRGRDKVNIDERNDEALDIRDQLESPDGQPRQLAPGQKLMLAVKARDAYALGEPASGGHEGTSQRFLLDVVTPDQLRTLLEARELNLRLRFETILAEVTQTADSLRELDLAAAAGAEIEVDDENEDETDATVEPEDEEGIAPQRATPAQQAEIEKLRLERVVQNSQKNALETRGVAEGFDDIRLELINNRVDTEELKSRLQEGIADPLRAIADAMFPELDRRLAALREQLADERAAPPLRNAAQRQIDAIVVQMQQVLGKMLELETFNEALTLLRGIIESQDELNRRTEEERKRGLRDLLEE